MLIQEKNHYYQENHELASLLKKSLLLIQTKFPTPRKKREGDFNSYIAHSK